MTKFLALFLAVVTTSLPAQTPDIYVVTQFGPDLLCLNAGGGVFDCRESTPGNQFYTGVTSADFNGDGLEDVLRADAFGPASLCLADGNGDLDCQDVPGLGGVLNVTHLDADGDGDADAFFAGQGPNVICLNDGAGNFDCSILDTTDQQFTSDVVALDANGDGLADVALANRDSAGVGTTATICLGDGLGGFDCAPVGGDVVRSTGIAAADMDGDGFVDLALANGINVAGPNTVCYGNGDGTFTCAPVESLSGDSRGVAIGDFNADGFGDVVFSRAGSAVNRICFGGAGRAFSCRDLDPATSANSTSANAADLDLDGDIDLLITEFGRRPRLGLNDGAGNFTWSSLGTLAVNANDATFIDLDLSTRLTAPAAAVNVFPAPNPAANFTVLRGAAAFAPAGHIRLFDALGRPVIDRPVGDGRLNLSGLANGTYALRLSDGRGQALVIRRLVIQR